MIITVMTPADRSLRFFSCRSISVWTIESRS